eukprot:768813-Hanusia_phi.AAC.5
MVGEPLHLVDGNSLCLHDKLGTDLFKGLDELWGLVAVDTPGRGGEIRAVRVKSRQSSPHAGRLSFYNELEQLLQSPRFLPCLLSPNLSAPNAGAEPAGRKGSPHEGPEHGFRRE